MYSPLQLAGKYLRYLLTSSNGKGHGVHSPFVYALIRDVLQNKKELPAYQAVEPLRKSLLQNKTVIEIADFGAGSVKLKSNQRVIQQIAASSLKPKKFAQLLHRMVAYYQPATILELGTSLGITTAYLSLGNPGAKVFTCEGAPSIAAVAQQQFDTLGLQQIKLITGNFSETLSPVLQQIAPVNFAFVDGNHRRQPTIDYFEKLLPVMPADGILVFDDIHWSKEMESAWAYIQQHPSVTLTIDLFFIGIVLINPDFKVKQHFTISF